MDCEICGEKLPWMRKWIIVASFDGLRWRFISCKKCSEKYYKKLEKRYLEKLRKFIEVDKN